ncbi:MAG: ArsR family transcriptional regulator [Nanoarchaeota archaeon]|nr:ArsR family transcriptional regulator [Nanoarchaeota archaeon]
MNTQQLVSFVLRAKNRIKTLRALEKSPKIPAQIMKETGMYKSHTSRALKELKENNLIQCDNPNDRAYKFYTLTKAGKAILKKAREIKKNIEE